MKHKLAWTGKNLSVFKRTYTRQIIVLNESVNILGHSHKAVNEYYVKNNFGNVKNLQHQTIFVNYIPVNDDYCERNASSRLMDRNLDPGGVDLFVSLARFPMAELVRNPKRRFTKFIFHFLH